MKWAILGAALVAAGCVQTAGERAVDYWGEHSGVIAAQKKPKKDLQAAWGGKTNPWAGMKKMKDVPSDVIGGRSGFEKRKASRRASARASAGTIAVPGIAAGKAAGTPGLSRELHVLSSRVEKLERMATSGSASPAMATAARPVATAPAQMAAAIAIYKAHPNGRTAWIAAGSSSGIREGQTFQVARGGTSVAQVRVARVWPKVSELTVLWANGKLQRGDAVAVAQ